MTIPNSQMPAQALGNVDRIHFVGIGGTGMSGIAEVLSNLGYHVSGSDIKESAVTQRLASLGVTINIGHKRENIAEVDVVVAYRLFRARKCWLS